MHLETQADLSVVLQGSGFSGQLNAAFIERENQPIRRGEAALARRTWATRTEVLAIGRTCSGVTQNGQVGRSPRSLSCSRDAHSVGLRLGSPERAIRLMRAWTSSSIPRNVADGGENTFIL